MGNGLKYIGKCLYIEENNERALVIGDLHLGYEEALNRSGIFVMRQMLNNTIGYLTNVFSNAGKVDKVVLLGDVKHEFGNINRQEWDESIKLFEFLRKYCDEIVIVRGNHDIFIDSLVKRQLGIKVYNFYVMGKYCFLHGDKDHKEIYNKQIEYWILGHGHPAIRLSDGVKNEKYKCFLEGEYKGKKIIIVPSFGEESEGTDPRENDLELAWNMKLTEFRVLIVDKLNVRDFGKLRSIKK